MSDLESLSEDELLDRIVQKAKDAGATDSEIFELKMTVIRAVNEVISKYVTDPSS